MNMNQSPNLDALRRLVIQCDDQAGHHLLWIDRSGQVTITRLSSGDTPALWLREHQGQVAVRLESFQRGGGYVGPKAGADEAYLKGLLAEIQEAWDAA